MKNLVSKIFAPIAIMIGLAGCPWAGGNKDYSLTNISLTHLGKDYVKPSGVNEYNLPSSRSISKDAIFDGDIIFTQRPVLQNTPTLDDFISYPKISLYSNSAQKGTVDLSSDLYEFTGTDSTGFLADLPHYDMAYQQYQTDSGTKLVPKQLYLETVVLPDSSILLSSSISDKLFRIYDDNGTYQSKIFAEDERLRGIDDMIMDSDSNKVYAAKGNEILSIDIDTKQISDEFILPEQTGITGKVSIVKNSAQGFADTGNKFYVSDYGHEKIYAIDGNNNVSIFMENIGNPTDLTVSENGDLFVSFAPKLDFSSGTVLQDSRIDSINSQTKEVTNLYTSENDSFSDFSTGDYDPINNLPLGCDISMVLEETPSDLTLYVSNGWAGTLDTLTATKSY